MRSSLIVASLSVSLFAYPVLAEQHYRFHIRLTDGKTALLANPQKSTLKLTEETLEHAAKSHVLLLDHTSGAHWTWLMLGSENENPGELGINAHGGAKLEEADLAFEPNAGGKSVRTRCLHDTCHIDLKRVTGKESHVSLAKNETRDLPLDADFDVTFDQ